MNAFKNLCMVLVLGAVGYGAYQTLTGTPLKGPPPEVLESIAEAPRIDMPSLGGGSPPEVALPSFGGGPPALSAPRGVGDGLGDRGSLAPPAKALAPASSGDPPPTGPALGSSPTYGGGPALAPVGEPPTASGDDARDTSTDGASAGSAANGPAATLPGTSIYPSTPYGEVTLTPPANGPAASSPSGTDTPPPLGPPSGPSASSGLGTSSPSAPTSGTTSPAATLASPFASPSGSGADAPWSPSTTGTGSPSGAGSADPAVVGERYASRTAPPSTGLAAPPLPGPASSASATSAATGIGSAPAAADPQFAQSVAEIQQQLSRGQLAEAHLALSSWFDDPQLAPADAARVMDLLGQLAGSVIYSTEHYLEPAYEVRPGDNLERIAKQYNVPWQLLAKINGISDPRRLTPGQKLKVLRGPFDAVVDLERMRLTLFLQGRYAGQFPIGLGTDRPLVEGEFVVMNKVTNPSYYGRDGMIDADDPSNPLGERWLDLGSQIGIHGCPDPRGVGQVGGKGCVRLHPQDAQDVYDILDIGSRVIMRR